MGDRICTSLLDMELLSGEEEIALAMANRILSWKNTEQSTIQMGELLQLFHEAHTLHASLKEKKRIARNIRDEERVKAYKAGMRHVGIEYDDDRLIIVDAIDRTPLYAFPRFYGAYGRKEALQTIEDHGFTLEPQEETEL